MRNWLSTFLFILLPVFSIAQKSFHFSPELIEAYHDILALRISQGEASLEKLKEGNPHDPAIAFVSDYAYFLRSFINEDNKAFHAEVKLFNERLSLAEKSDERSPFHLYAQAEMLVHQAALRFKFRDYVDGVTNIRSAFKKLEENIKKYPKFQPNYKTMGMLEVLVGTVPDKYSWMVSAIGLHGDIKQGMSKIEGFMTGTFTEPEVTMLKKEGLFIYSFLQLHVVKEQEEAWKKVELATRDYKENLLNCYIRSSIGMRCKKTEEVIKTLTNRPRGNEYLKFYFLEYMLGNALLSKLDTKAAIHYKIFVTFFKGENYIKDAYLKLAWCSLLEAKANDYATYLGMVRSRGKNNFEEDKQAARWAEQTTKINLPLLKGRLLFDGGYLKEALIQLEKAKQVANGEHEQLEQVYRTGRVYHEMKDYVNALKFYEETIRIGEQKPWYFAANSALHIAMISEERHDCTKAKLYYNRVLKMPNEEYRQGIQARAKAGLKRCG
ncbi:MAG: hypothetical protein EP332_06970 [Bacteroidetes bacterium]|nr:MAG: hypothetical protein EP332_06970 [Bacteroidota bacterium]